LAFDYSLAGFGGRLFPRFSVEPLRMNLREFRNDAIGGHASAKERVSATPQSASPFLWRF